MKAKLIVLISGFLLAGVGLLADEPANLSRERRIAQLISDLDNARFATRQNAQEELVKVGKVAVPLLKQALAGRPNLEAAVRIRAILRQLALRTDCGPAGGDLQVRLAADRKAVKPGEKVKLTVTLFNIGDEDLNVQVGYTTCGNYFECGRAFQRIAEAPVSAKCRVGFCGTGAGPMIVTIPAEGSIEYITEATLAKPEKEGPGYSFGKNRYFSLESPLAGTHRLRTTLSASPMSGFPVGPRFAHLPRPRNEKARYWSGNVFSNEVEFQVVP